MAGSPRKLLVTYGSYTIGGPSQNAHLDGPLEIVGSYETDVISFAAVLFATSDSDMSTKVQAFEAAFSTPRGALTITQSSQTLLSRLPSSNTGFNAVPTFQKLGGVADTGLSRRYQITITVMKPANLAGQDGRRNATVRIAYDPSERITVTFKGEYTALGSNSARAQYAASSPTYYTSFLAGITGTFEKVTEETDEDDTNKVLQYVAVFHEILYAQSAAGTDHSAVVEHTVRFKRTLEAPGDWGRDTVRLTDVLVTYDCNVKKATTGLNSLWKDTLRPFILAQANGTFSPAYQAVVAEDVDLDATSNRITALLRMKMAIGTNNILEATVTQELSDDLGNIRTPVWDGAPFGKHVDKGPATRIRTTTKRFLVKGGVSLKKWVESGGGGDFSGAVFYGSASENGGQAVGSSGFGGSQGNIDQTGWILIQGTSSARPMTIGIGDEKVDLTEYTERAVEEYVTNPGSGGGGSGFQKNFVH